MSDVSHRLITNQETPNERTTLNITKKWAKLIYRLFSCRGRVMVTITVDEDGKLVDWTVMPLGSVEGKDAKVVA